MTSEENELLTRTGPGTPMGRLIRRYSIPALFSHQLPEPDCPPLRVTLLGERLVAFRDSTGQPGLLEEHCAHRGASLFFGRNEEHGLRCVYHGWKFDVAGTCVDMPNEPAESNFKTKVRLTAYPCQERGGVIWAYLGPAELRPGLPEFEWAVIPASHRFATRRVQECNWFQALEGGFDPTHVPILHGGAVAATGNGYSSLGHAGLEVARTPFGLSLGHRREGDADHTLWRVNQWLLPFSKMIAPRARDAAIGFHAWVPVDDERCMVYSVDWHPDRPLTDEELEPATTWTDIHAETYPGTDRTVLNRENDYLVDRALQRSGKSFTGIKGLGMQDGAIQESQGPIYDRSQEHLFSGDLAIVTIRTFLLQLLKELEAGEQLPGVDPTSHRVRAGSFLLPKAQHLADAPPELVAAHAAAYSAL